MGVSKHPGGKSTEDNFAGTLPFGEGGVYSTFRLRSPQAWVTCSPLGCRTCACFLAMVHSSLSRDGLDKEDEKDKKDMELVNCPGVCRRGGYFWEP